MERSYRYRVNVGQSVKGVLTFDATVEVEGTDAMFPSELERDALQRSDALVAELRRRYPPVPEEGKAKP